MLELGRIILGREENREKREIIRRGDEPTIN